MYQEVYLTHRPPSKMRILAMILLRNIFSFSVGFLFFAERGFALVDLFPSVPSPQVVGTTVQWHVLDPTPYTLWRFEVLHPNGRTTIARDFDLYHPLSWTPFEEGYFTIMAKAGNSYGSYLEEDSFVFHVTTLVPGVNAVVSSTNHPLVALYSAPPCPRGQKVLVQFRQAGHDSEWIPTLPKDCDASKSVNFLVAGMMGETEYEMRHVGGGGAPSSITSFTTGTAEIYHPNFDLTVPHDIEQSGVILSAALFTALGHSINPYAPSGSILEGLACPYATDLEGNLIWYYKDPLVFQHLGSAMNSFPSRPKGETFFMHMSRFLPGSPMPLRGQLLREIDLAGNTIRETNVERINYMLNNLGTRNIYYFHHDTRMLPDGRLLVMAGVERVYPLPDDSGSTIEVDIVGDMIIVLDENLEVIWAWDSTADWPGLSLERRALRDELCNAICGPLRETTSTRPAYDWTHGNTVTYDPNDANLLISFRHQDWVIKIDYNDGFGSGDIIWRLGKDGDFELLQDGIVISPDHWFSGQHQPLVYGNEIVVYDNANALNEVDPAMPFVNSRGQVYVLDEDTLTAELVVNSDLGVYAPFLGSSQRLENGNYHFFSGGAIDPTVESPAADLIPSGSSESSEVDSEGTIVYTLRAPGIVSYRSFRMKSLYETDEHPIYDD